MQPSALTCGLESTCTLAIYLACLFMLHHVRTRLRQQVWHLCAVPQDHVTANQALFECRVMGTLMHVLHAVVYFCRTSMTATKLM